MRRRTPTRAREERQYLKRSKEFLAEYPNCVRCFNRLMLGQTDHIADATEIHHTAGRDGGRLLDERRWCGLCRPCHQWVTEHPAEAVAQHYSMPRVGSGQCSRTSWSDRCTFTDGHIGLCSWEPETVLDGP